ncbi:hypothetical protein B0H16DRAFT_1879313 [Mycena metata]|uniref:Uncharacterized protein n=1 Tax=Mycena metata TaxID=1033252 RepID=A0AAD7K7C8_9AGAR|nr:hypothetical protein B0H16DRAFT_1879313 [Mycena metata]
MAENPGVPHSTMFAYRYGAVKITVHDISATHVGSATWDSFHGPAAWAALSGAPEWINDAARCGSWWSLSAQMTRGCIGRWNRSPASLRHQRRSQSLRTRSQILCEA